MNIAQGTLAKLRTLFGNAHSTPASHVPTFTQEELDYLDGTLKSELNIPEVWVQVAHNPNMTLDQIKDPDEVEFLKNLKTLIDARLDQPVPSAPSTSALTYSAVTTSDAEKNAVADQVAKENPPPEPAPLPPPEVLTAENAKRAYDESHREEPPVVPPVVDEPAVVEDPIP